MVPVPHNVMTGFVKLLDIRGIPDGQVEYYQKWLRYFYDFSAKYQQEQGQAEKVRLFLDKLKRKGQSSAHCQQAAYAVALYFEFLGQPAPGQSNADDQTPGQSKRRRARWTSDRPTGHNKKRAAPIGTAPSSPFRISRVVEHRIAANGVRFAMIPSSATTDGPQA